jgi:hypothetical protein
MAKIQNGFVVKIGSNWYVRSWERRVVNGVVVRQRVSHKLGPVTTKGKKPPADVVAEAAQHMAVVNAARFVPEQIVTVGDFVERIYIPRGRRTQAAFHGEGLQGHLAASPQTGRQQIVAQERAHAPRPGLARRTHQTWTKQQHA